MDTSTLAARGNFTELALPFEEALARLPAALQKEGFGVITQIDLKETFKNKLGKDFRRYRIIGACNPSFALQAVTTDPFAGLLLPCNVVLYETDDGHAMLGAIDPIQSIGGEGAPPDLARLAGQVGERLERVLATMATTEGSAS